jgi:hypothetical protein
MEKQIGTMAILANTVEDTIPQAKRQYIIGVDDEELRRGIMGGTIPSTIADSNATSGDGPSHLTGEPSDKRFILPSGEVIQATEKVEYPFNVRAPANKLHITPAISQHSLLSTENTQMPTTSQCSTRTPSTSTMPMKPSSPTRDAILRGWRDTDNKLWLIPLVDMVQNQNTDTIIVNRLSSCPIACPPTTPSTTFTS